jgi:hypothetical protein
MLLPRDGRWDRDFETIEEMDHAETVAKRLLERVLAGAHMQYRAAQSNGEYDFDLYYPDGRVSAVEVTSSVDKTLEETHDAIIDQKRGGRIIPTHLCRNSWHISPAVSARINRLRKEADGYLAAIETAGIEKFWGPTNDDPSVEAIYLDLGVISGSVTPWSNSGQILIALPGVHGTVGARSVIEIAERETFKADNRKKLAAARHEERHLAVYVYLTSLPWAVLTHFEPPRELPHLPHEITDVWVFSETAEEPKFVAWRASTLTRWEKLTLSVEPGPAHFS